MASRKMSPRMPMMVPQPGPSAPPPGAPPGMKKGGAAGQGVRLLDKSGLYPKQPQGKPKNFAKGGYTSAADGVAQSGKTRGKQVTMKSGGRC